MSTRRRPGREKEQSSPRSKTPVLSIAFAIAMAFFLVIGMVAVALPEFMGGDEPEAEQPEPPANMQEQGEGEEEELRERLEEDPDDASAMTQLAVFLSNSGRVEEAIPYYEDALEARPEDDSLRLSFARALNRQGYTLDAEVQLEQVLEEDPENVEAMYLMAEVKEQEGADGGDEATALYEQIVEIDPESYYAEMARERLGDGGDGGEGASGEGNAGDSDENQD